MFTYIFAYHGGVGHDKPEEGARFMARWRDWVGTLGDAVVNPGSPLGHNRTVSVDDLSDDGGPNPVTGFSMIRAESIDDALEMAGRCPHLEHGTIEVALVKENWPT